MCGGKRGVRHVAEMGGRRSDTRKTKQRSPRMWSPATLATLASLAFEADPPQPIGSRGRGIPRGIGGARRRGTPPSLWGRLWGRLWLCVWMSLRQGSPRRLRQRLHRKLQQQLQQLLRPCPQLRSQLRLQLRPQLRLRIRLQRRPRRAPGIATLHPLGTLPLSRRSQPCAPTRRRSISAASSAQRSPPRTCGG